MEPLTPETPAAMAEVLASAAGEGKRIALRGAGTKRRMDGGRRAADVTISTSAMSRIIEYEPRDLTISVESGLRFSELVRRIAEDGLMLPLDPPFFDGATVGGVVAANTSGSRRRSYGTARDLVIGAQFATLDGKLVQSGGMVVKNAAGLEMAKLLIGSFGTLAGIASVNFRLAPRPPSSRTFVMGHASLLEALTSRDALTRSVLQPAAIDLLNPPGAKRIGLDGYPLLVQAEGSRAVVERYARELPEAQAVEGMEEARLWESVREFAPIFLAEHHEGAVVRVSTTISGVGEVLDALSVPALARAGSGVVYGFFPACGPACEWVSEVCPKGWRAVVEHVSEAGCEEDRWPIPGDDLRLVERVKAMFDPNHLLNQGMLYGRL